MNEFDEQMKQAFRRREPPADLANRILASPILERPIAKKPGASPRWWQVAAAAALIAGGIPAWHWHAENQRQEQAELVRQQVAEAVTIAYRQIARASERANRIGVERIQYRETSQ